MNNVEFKIFGAPHTFDMYQGSEGEIGYFQNFDNGGKEKVKFTIHRMVSGKVSYSYLRYNFISSSGRPNSFFGMSVVFDQHYCKDIDALFKLFDAVYEGIVLNNKILLEELDNHPSAQAKYLVRAFSEKPGEVKNIENNILTNLSKYFSDDIIPIDDSFSASNSMVRINDQMDNDSFVQALKKYSWVHISPQYSKTATPVPNPEFLAGLDEVITRIEKQFQPLAVKIAKKESIQAEVHRYDDEIQNALEKIATWLDSEYKQKKGSKKSHLQKQPDLKERHDKLEEIRNTLGELRTAVVTKPQGPNPDSNPDSGADKSKLAGPAFWRKNKRKIIAGILAGIAIVALSLLIPRLLTDMASEGASNEPAPPQYTTEDYERIGNEALENQKFDEAIIHFRKADKDELVALAEAEAIQYWNDKAANAKSFEEAIGYLENTVQYGNNPANDIAEFEQKISARNAANRRPQPATPREPSPPPAEEPQVELNCIEEATIRIPNEAERKKGYSKGNRFTVLAKSSDDPANCSEGKWDYDYGLFANKDQNPTVFEVTAVPNNGRATLRFVVNGKVVAAYSVTILP